MNHCLHVMYKARPSLNLIFVTCSLRELCPLIFATQDKNYRNQELASVTVVFFFFSINTVETSSYNTHMARTQLSSIVHDPESRDNSTSPRTPQLQRRFSLK